MEFTQFDHLEEHVRSREDEYAAVSHSCVDLKNHSALVLIESTVGFATTLPQLVVM
jgi:hypothetical protein